MKQFLFLILFMSSTLYAQTWDKCSKYLVKGFFEETQSMFHQEKFKILNEYACNFPNEIPELTQWIVERSNSANSHYWRERKCSSPISSDLLSFFYNNADSKAHENWKQCKLSNSIPHCQLLNPSDGMYNLQVQIPSGYQLESYYDVKSDNALFYTGEPNYLQEGFQEFYFTKWEPFGKAWIEIESLCRVETLTPKNWGPLHTPVCATAFEHIHNGGRAINLYNSYSQNGVSNLAEFGMHNMISSALVTPGCRLEIYTQNNYQGRSFTLHQDHGDFRHIPIGQDTSNSLRCVCQ